MNKDDPYLGPKIATIVLVIIGAIFGGFIAATARAPNTPPMPPATPVVAKSGVYVGSPSSTAIALIAEEMCRSFGGVQEITRYGSRESYVTNITNHSLSATCGDGSDLYRDWNVKF
jgi:hypothetical protein